MKIPKAIQNLTEAFERLPGIGTKTAARLTFYLLHVPEAERQKLGQAVLELGRKTAICERCFNICDASDSAGGRLAGGTPRISGNLTASVGGARYLCDICRDPNRDRTKICVVEDPLDLMAFERTGKYNGLYHVLGGVIAPLEHIGPEDLKIDELLARLKPLTSEESGATSDVVAKSASSDGGSSRVKEIILATNPSLEGEATAMYIKQLIGKQLTADGEGIKITRIARGIPTGGDLEYADQATLTKALEGRQDY